MLIGYKDDENDTHTSTRTSTHTSSIDIQPSSENVTRLVLAIGKEEMSVKNMMEAVGLKNRPNFMDYSLTPAIREGFVCMKYPANPHHPRQRYLLTVEGLMLLLPDAGRGAHEQAVEKALTEYDKFRVIQDREIMSD